MERFMVIGSGADASVLSFGPGSIYVGGNFYNIGGDTIKNIAVHYGNFFYRVGHSLNGAVLALNFDEFFPNWLVAGGLFGLEYSGDTILHHIARFTGSAWVHIGSGFNDIVASLTNYNGSIIA